MKWGTHSDVGLLRWGRRVLVRRGESRGVQRHSVVGEPWGTGGAPRETVLNGALGPQVGGLWRAGAEHRKVGMSGCLGAWRGRHTQGVMSPRGGSGRGMEVGLSTSTGAVQDGSAARDGEQEVRFK